MSDSKSFLEYFGIEKKTQSPKRRRSRHVPIICPIMERRLLLHFPLSSSVSNRMRIYERPEVYLSRHEANDSIREYDIQCATGRSGRAKAKVKKKSNLIAQYFKARKRLRVLYNPPKKKCGPTLRISNLNLFRYSPFFRFPFSARERRERARQLEFGLTRSARALTRQMRACRVCVSRMDPHLCRAYQDLCQVRLKRSIQAKSLLPKSFMPTVTLTRLNLSHVATKSPPPRWTTSLRASKVAITDYIDLDADDKDDHKTDPEFTPTRRHCLVNNSVDLDEDDEVPAPPERRPTLSLVRLTADQVASGMVSLDSMFQHSLLKVCLSRFPSIKTEPIDTDFFPLTSLSRQQTIGSQFSKTELTTKSTFAEPQFPPPAFLDPEEISFFRDTSSVLENVQDLDSNENASITSSSATSAVASSDHVQARLGRSCRSPLKDFLRSNAYRKYINEEAAKKSTQKTGVISDERLSVSLRTTEVAKLKSPVPRPRPNYLKRLGINLVRKHLQTTRSQTVGRSRRHRK